jgi:glucose/arabinose dehydrogenase
MPRFALAPLVAVVLLAGCSSRSAAPAPALTTRPTPSPTPSATPTPEPTVLPGAFSLQELGTFSNPVWVGPVPGDPAHLYLVEKTGKVLQIDPTGKQLSTVLDLTDQVSKGNEQGMLSVAFDPAYATTHRLYVDYTDKGGNTVVAAYAVTDDKATSPQQLLTVQQPYPNHNGGLLLFDKTGMLLVGLGDGGSAGDPGNRAQDVHSNLGKILRLDPKTGAGAAGNPYPVNRLVWALGLRNPWRFSFDSEGYLYIGDVGQNTTEELDVVAPAYQRGANYGWSVYEGNKRFKADEQFTPGGTLITPALTYLHEVGGCSITGGESYAGRAIPELAGMYVFGDYCAGKLMATTRTGSAVSPPALLGLKVDGLQAFGHDAAGELLVLSSEKLYRLVPGKG